MSLYFDQSLKSIKASLANMSAAVEAAVERSLTSFFEFDPGMAHSVVENDRVIHSFEIDIDTNTYKFLALRRPEGVELRELLTIQRINTFLERIGDHAVNIAESATTEDRMHCGSVFYELPEMAHQARRMLTDALSCFLTGDTGKASDVMARDEKVDVLNASMSSLMKAKALSGEVSIETAMEFIRVSKNIERIADLSTNIAEESIFASQGVIVKHHASENLAEGTFA